MAYCFLLSSKNISFACNAGNFLAYDVSEVSTVLTIENGIIDVQKAINFIFLVFGFCSLFTDLQKKVLVSYKKWAPVVQFRLLCCCWVWFFLTTCFYLNKLGWMINTQAKRRSGTSLLLKMCTIDIRFVCLYSRRKYVLSKLLWVFNTLAQVQNVWNAILILF